MVVNLINHLDKDQKCCITPNVLYKYLASFEVKASRYTIEKVLSDLDDIISNNLVNNDLEFLKRTSDYYKTIDQDLSKLFQQSGIAYLVVPHFKRVSESNRMILVQIISKSYLDCINNNSQIPDASTYRRQCLLSPGWKIYQTAKEKRFKGKSKNKNKRPSKYDKSNKERSLKVTFKRTSDIRFRNSECHFGLGGQQC